MIWLQGEKVVLHDDLLHEEHLHDEEHLQQEKDHQHDELLELKEERR